MQLGTRSTQRRSAGPGANRLVRAAVRRGAARRQADRGRRGRDKPNFVWKVTLLRKNEANAYCLPGGKIVVYTGILPLTEERRRARDGARARGRPCDGRARCRADRAEAPDRGRRRHHRGRRRVHARRSSSASSRCWASASSLPFSRSQESEADHIGLVYMARAGYDPHQAVAFWKRMLRASKGQGAAGVPERPPERRAPGPAVEGWLPEAEREYSAGT